MPTREDYLAAAWDAAPVFGLEPTEISVLAQSENVVCDVQLPDRQVVMRFHRPGYNSIDELVSEVEWVRSLAHAGIAVPTAVPTTAGDHYVAADVAGETTHVGVVGWVPGQPVSIVAGDDAATVVPFYRTIGVLAAKIRHHSLVWTPPDGFVRRRWDRDGLVGDDPLWDRFWEAEGLTDDQRAICVAARDKLRGELGALSIASDRFGLIHADLHLDNLMASGESLTVIDFDDAGYGWFAHELAVSLYSVLDKAWYHDCKAAMLDGYRTVSPLDDTDEALIDTFIVVRCLMNIGWLNARRELPDFDHFDDLAAHSTGVAEHYLAS